LLTLFKEIIVDYIETHTRPINTEWTITYWKITGDIKQQKLLRQCLHCGLEDWGSIHRYEQGFFKRIQKTCKNVPIRFAMLVNP
jgi:hypothetical protein